MNQDAAITLVIVAIVFAYLSVKAVLRARVREAEIRERIALIERGLVPPPEVDPPGFDRAMGRLQLQRPGGPARHRRAGVTLIGVGLGLMVLIGFTSGEPGTAIGVGGFLVVLGFAFFVNSLLEPERPESPAPAAPPDPSIDPES